MRIFLVQLAVFIIGFAIFATAQISSKRDMTVCQLTHSFDTCFQALNR